MQTINCFNCCQSIKQAFLSFLFLNIFTSYLLAQLNVPVIDSINPLKGHVGQQVRINGSGFSANITDNIVYFGGAKAYILSATPTTIDVTVPAGATYAPVSVSTSGHSVQSKLPFNLTYEYGLFTTSTFLEQFIPPSNDYSTYNTSVLDVDGDGLNDIVVNFHGTAVNSFPYDDHVAIYRNTTSMYNNFNVSFANVVKFKTSGQMTRNVGFADFDGDGKLDLVALNEPLWSGGGSVNIFRNISTPGNISFSNPLIIGSGGLTTNISIADLNADGKLDFAVANANSQVLVFKNTSSTSGISFSNFQLFSLPPQAACTSVWLGDVDKDDKPDLIATDNFNDSIYIFKNISELDTISLAVRKGYDIGHRTAYVTMADINSDGALDIVLGSGIYNHYSSGDSVIIILRNQSTAGNFVLDTMPYLINCRPGLISISDLDGDGKPDISTINRNAVSLFKNTSTVAKVSFGPAINPALSSYLYIENAGTGDLNGDGKPDIVVCSETATFRVLVNQNGSNLIICPNESAQLYSNLDLGGLYRWLANTGSGFINISDNQYYSGTTGPVLTLSNIPSSYYGYQYVCRSAGVYSKITTVRFENIWTGAVSSAWENPGNWSCGSIPDANTDVRVDSGRVIINSNVVIRSLLLNPDAVLTVNTPNTITVLR